MNSYLLEMPAPLWARLVADLRERGRGVRESGAFLLGEIGDGARRVQAWVPYDELDPEALTRGYICLSTAAFTKLWAKCSTLGLVVVGDVHTHPYGPRQSLSDKTNPMISQAGHVALIVPRYATGRVAPSDVSVNVYLGAKRWSSFFGPDAQKRIRLV
jgi:proteasome lid subunit RPN8/RPN11